MSRNGCREMAGGWRHIVGELGSRMRIMIAVTHQEIEGLKTAILLARSQWIRIVMFGMSVF
jgi:hypothetical protein